MKRGVAGFFLAALAAFGAINALAYRYALTMVRYGPPELLRTRKPDQLGLAEKVQVLLNGIVLPRPVARRTPAEVGLSFTILRLHSSDGVELEAWNIPLDGAQGTAILWHGYAAEKSVMLPVAAALRRLGWATLLVDFRGVGGSDGSESNLGWKEAEDVASVLRYVRQLSPESPIVVYAVSMGAAAALRAAGPLGVSPDALILESPFDTLEQTTRRRFKMMGLPSWPFTDALIFWGSFHTGFSAAEHAPMRYAAQVKVPTLLLHGALDKYVTVEDAGRVAAALGEHGTLVVFPKSAHGKFLEGDPERWNEVVTALLSPLRASPPRQQPPARR